MGDVRLTIAMLILCIGAAGCNDNRQERRVMSVDKNGGVYRICGQTVRLTPPGAADTLYVTDTANGVSFRIPMTVLPRRAGDEPLGGDIAVFTTCVEQSQSIWVTGAALQLPWQHVTPRPELGLTEYRANADIPHSRDIAYAADASYVKPDGSVFIMQCHSNDGITPIACMVDYGLAPGLIVTYRYHTAGALHRWKEVDQLVRATIKKE